MRRSKTETGFTIIEVILFLALTGVFLLVAFNGLYQNTDTVRFTDGGRSLESFINSQLRNVVNGVNIIGTGDDENEIILGKLFEMSPGSQFINTYDIIGDRLSSADVDSGDDVFDRIQTSNPRILGASLTYETDWQLEYRSGRSDPCGAGTNMFGFMRDPYGTNIIPIVLLAGNPGLSAPNILYVGESWIPKVDGCIQARYCFEGTDNQVARLETSPSALSSTGQVVQVVFDADLADCS
jgi:type II secretory pathway pseudopilin PulG